jgi:hypothetical protein
MRYPIPRLQHLALPFFLLYVSRTELFRYFQQLSFFSGVPMLCWGTVHKNRTCFRATKSDVLRACSVNEDAWR